VIVVGQKGSTFLNDKGLQAKKPDHQAVLSPSKVTLLERHHFISRPKNISS